MANRTVHLRKVRAKDRVTLSKETNQSTKQVFTLCGKWKSPGHTLREDTKKEALICDECKAQRDMTKVFGE